MTDPETDVARLAEALLTACRSAFPEEAQVAALMPVVDAIARQRAAEELEAAADCMFWPNSQNCGPELRARAAALRNGAQ